MNVVKKRQNAEIRKPDIIRNFYQVVLEEGIEGASIGKVAKRMKIHPSLVIHYFHSKDNLTVALVDYVIHEAGKIYQKLSMETHDPEKRLKNLINIFFSEEWDDMTDIGADFAFFSLCYRNSQVNERIRNMYKLLKKLITSELEKAIKAGCIPFKDPVRAADIIITVYEGYRHFKQFYVDEADINSFRNDMVNMIMEALNRTNNQATGKCMHYKGRFS